MNNNYLLIINIAKIRFKFKALAGDRFREHFPIFNTIVNTLNKF